eukprot:TRINITY_DN4778_c0_g1_i1.p1 TRINITY_DN4778_c0_g1~~TRINITY_DN4778_c0_g1_i1.p1  ORF type:complete len:310 (-),score=52.49 TRINITY_DN4778_c0_g1_i1:15-944(-)
MSQNSSDSIPNDTTFLLICLQLNVVKDKEQNIKNAEEQILEAGKQHPNIIVLPEMWNTPYSTKLFREYSESSGGPSTTMLARCARSLECYIVGGSIPELDQGKVYNTCFAYGPDGNMVAKHRKVHLFDIDIPGKISFKESDTLSAGNSLTHFSTPFGNVGIGICFDIRFPELSRILATKYQCSLIVFPAAFNTTTGPLHWDLLLRSRAVDCQCYVCGVAPASASANSDSDGNSDGEAVYAAWSHSAVVDPWGAVVATAASTAQHCIVASLRHSTVDNVRRNIPSISAARNDVYSLSECESHHIEGLSKE